jgi:hypothetical protein
MKKAPPAKKKPVMTMESSNNNDLDLTLKVVLAENIMNPNRIQLKEAAVVMNDMLDAIDLGQNHLSPMVRSKYYQG